jgi:hypothetical protein
MRHLRMVGICLVAAFAIAAVAATSASALPEFGKCEVQEKHEGAYSDSNCQKKAKVVNLKKTGAFEWVNATKIPLGAKHRKFSSYTSGTGILGADYKVCQPAQLERHCAAGEEVNFAKLGVECTTMQDQGEISPTNAKKVQNVSVVFNGCTLGGSSPCGNGSKEGEIRIESLKGELGYIKKAVPKEVGVLLEPAVKGGLFTKFSCAGIVVVSVGGAKEAEGPAYPPAYPPKGGGDGIISPITPINEMTELGFTQKYTFNETTDENIPNKFEGKSLKVLETYFGLFLEPGSGSAWSKAGESIEVTNRTGPCEYGVECTTEIKA